MESRQRKDYARPLTALQGDAAPAESERAIASSMPPPQTFGRYVLHAPIARGGMASIYIARLIGAEGFSRLVAAKRLHPQFTEDPDFVAMFHDEARIASSIHHPNVVPVLDVVRQGQEVIIVQEYVHGVPLDKLFHGALAKEDGQIPIGIVVAVLTGVLAGLEAAHETKNERGERLEIVHRDVSPQNVMISVEGVPRLLDFGIAKAQSSAHVTREGFFKGKVAYMSPEQLRAENVTRAADIYACGVLLWELLAHRRLHTGRGEAELFHAVLSGAIPSLTAALDGTDDSTSDERWEQLMLLEPIVTCALATLPQTRFATAGDMMRAILAVCPAARPIEVAEWVRSQGSDYLDRRQTILASCEESWRSHSRIAAAAASLSGAPESIVKLAIRRDANGDEELLAPLSSLSSLGLIPSPLPSIDDSTLRARAVKHVAWIVAAALLLIVGVLLGVLTVRRPAEPAPLVAPQVAAQPPAPTMATALVTISPTEIVGPSPKPSHPAPAAPPPTPARTFAARPSSPPAHAPPPAPTHVAASPPLPPPAAASAPTPKNDCDPPFYFEGTKKVFKASCL